MFDSELSIEAASPTTWRLTRALVWTGERDTFSVPAGFVTDFATSPRFLHWLVLPYGPYTRAAVLHDFLLTQLAAWSSGAVALPEGRAGVTPDPPADSRDTDGVFRRAMRDLGTPWAKRWMMWAAVRAASCFNPDRAYGRAFLKDSPKVLGVLLAISVGSLGTIPVAAAAVLLALGFIRLFTAFSGRPSTRTQRRKLARFHTKEK